MDKAQTRVITIDREPAELYRFWRNFEQLPLFMQHLESVRVLDERRSHWVARGPLGTKAEWDAEILQDHENELISWRSLPEATIQHAGSVHFKPAPGDRGTEVRVRIAYEPPLGIVGRTVARLSNEEPGQQIADDLRNLKMMIEAGEIATNLMQPEERAREVGS
jgi:uncharacterized membrane protein